jgi:hypothetical protein
MIHYADGRWLIREIEAIIDRSFPTSWWQYETKSVIPEGNDQKPGIAVVQQHKCQFCECM